MALNGQMGPTTAGTPVVISSTAIGPGTYKLWPHPANGGTYMYLAYTAATCTSALGAVLKKGVDSIMLTVVDPADLWVDSDTDANTICYMRVEGENQGVKAPAG